MQPRHGADPTTAPAPLLAQLPCLLRAIARLPWAHDAYLQRTLADMFRCHFEMAVVVPQRTAATEDAALRALVHGLAPAADASDTGYALRRVMA